MTTTYTSAILSETTPNAADAFNTIAIHGSVTIKSGVVLGLNDIIELVNLPAYHKLVDFIVDTGDLDANGLPTLTLSAGFVGNGAPLDAPACLIASSTLGQSAGTARASAAGFTQIAPVTTDTIVGLKVTAAAATGPAADRVITGTLICRQQSSVFDLGL